MESSGEEGSGESTYTRDFERSSLLIRRQRMRSNEIGRQHTNRTVSNMFRGFCIVALRRGIIAIMSPHFLSLGDKQLELLQ